MGKESDVLVPVPSGSATQRAVLSGTPVTRCL